MKVYDAESYRQCVAAYVRPKSGRAWGAAKRLATALRCHSTYVSQIINGKANLSTEQAIAFCKVTGLDRDATDHFMDLLHRDKAGDQDTYAYFQSRIEKRLADRLNLKKRLKISESLTLEQQSRYYRGWLPQAVHMCCQLPGSHTVPSMAARLQTPESTLRPVVQELEAIGLIAKEGEDYQSVKDFVHLGNDSPLIGHFHANWRLKCMNDMTMGTTLPGTHYSSAFTLSHQTAQQIRELILRHVEEVREHIIPSPPEHIYLYCLDFYPISEAINRD